MSRRRCWLLALAAALAGGSGCGEPPPRPHVVFLLADDLGWGDVGYHGGEIPTPQIDALAAEGVRLEQSYAMQSCTPSRAALLTGRYPHRYGLEGGVIRRRESGGLPREERTLAEALRDAGYHTAIVGKWHLGHAQHWQRPTARGFDQQYGGYHGAGDYFTRRLAGEPDWYRDDVPLEEPGYTTDLLADEVVRVIRERPTDRPLFVYVPFTAPHEPLEATRECEQRVAGLPEGPRRRYAAVVACLDAAIGRILAALDEEGLREDTLVVFSSDNGGAPDGPASNAPLRGGKRSLYEGGLRVPTLAAWRGVLPAGATVDEPLHAVDWFPTLLRLAGGDPGAGPPLDGRDAWPTIAEGAPSPHEEILHRVQGFRRAIRRGDWKLVVDLEAGSEELYDVARDPQEQHDLAAEHPERVAELRARLQAHARESRPGQRGGTHRASAPAGP